MRIVTLLFATCILLSGGTAQTIVKADERIKAVYEESYIATLEEKNPQVLEYLNFSLDNGYFIDESFPPDKYETLPELFVIDPATKKVIQESVTGEMIHGINILACRFERADNARTYYRIGDTGKVIVLYSVKELTAKFNEYKKTCK